MPTAAERRASLRGHMADLAESGRHCHGCSGPCCTFRHNTMQVTPLEALDIVTFLRRAGRHTESTRRRLEDCVTRYDLAAVPGDGHRNLLRRSYTCPFHTPGPRGCSIDADFKPPGCLAFNPLEPGVTDGGHCASDTAALERREAEHGEDEATRNRDLGFDWAKAPIPVAVLALWNTAMEGATP